jgi:hypothetical protein
MATTISAQMTSQGLLIPRTAILEWLDQGLEIVKDKQHIVIQPRTVPRTERERVKQVLEQSGRLVNLDWPPTLPPLTDQERAELAQKFGVGRPLSEIIIEERGGPGCAHLSGRR